MSRKACQHGTVLPKGLVCDHGYIQVRVERQGHLFCHNYGPHTPYTQTLAEKLVAEKRQEILLDKFGLTPELPEKLFKDVVKIFFKYWRDEKDGDGRLKHNARAIQDMEIHLQRLTKAFGEIPYHKLLTPEIEAYKFKRLTGANPVLGTTMNRELAPLSSCYNKIKTLFDRKLIPLFKIPASNPYDSVEKAKLRVHKKLLSDYEVKKLHLACVSNNDPDAWEICKMILKSTLSVGDVERLEVGSIIDIERGKTGVPVRIPITVLSKLNFKNWRKRWAKIRTDAGFSLDIRDPEYVDARVLRKTGINWPKGKFDIKLVSEYAQHASVKTTENIYTVPQEEKLRPIAKFMEARIMALEDGSLGENNGAEKA